MLFTPCSSLLLLLPKNCHLRPERSRGPQQAPLLRLLGWRSGLEGLAVPNLCTIFPCHRNSRPQPRCLSDNWPLTTALCHPERSIRAFCECAVEGPYTRTNPSEARHNHRALLTCQYGFAQQPLSAQELLILPKYPLGPTKKLVSIRAS